MQSISRRFGSFIEAYGDAPTSTEAIASYVTVSLAGASWAIAAVAGDTPDGVLAEQRLPIVRAPANA
jgi:hypothetical protein